MKRTIKTARIATPVALPLVVALFAVLAWPGAAAAQEDRIYSLFLIDQLEYGFKRDGANALRFNALGWIGGDYNRLWINTEGIKPDGGSLEDTDVQLLYGRLISPFWDLQAGVRYFYPRSNAPSRGSAVFGIQGLAPYWFEVQAAGFISNRGEVSGRVEVEYDLRLTQRLIAQPRLETNIAIQEVRELGIGRGVNDVELGLRLRYEMRREFAPYIGISWTRKFGDTAEIARSDGKNIDDLAVVAGLRIWF